ncbi:MAG: cadherin-like beta sandwich domain-containing protein [Eubacteriales bacterium]|nr:cadherin-like beta sandwich domain-containing protein [Eubacteriales bacterium]
MKKKIAVAIALMLTVSLLVIGVCGNQKSYAKTAQLYLDISDVVKKEDTFTVRVKLESDVDLYSIEAYLNYDENLVEFVPEDDRITGSAGVIQLKDVYPVETKSAVYDITFKALEIGKTQMELSEVYLIDYADMDYIEAKTSTKSFSVAMNRDEDTDARLQSLEVAPGELTSAFQSNVYTYEMHVGMDVDMVGVSAKPMDSDAVVESEIPQLLRKGENVITITVTAPSGNVKVYTIKVYKEEIEIDSDDENISEYQEMPEEPTREEREEVIQTTEEATTEVEEVTEESEEAVIEEKEESTVESSDDETQEPILQE